MIKPHDDDQSKTHRTGEPRHRLVLGPAWSIRVIAAAVSADEESAENAAESTAATTRGSGSLELGHGATKGGNCKFLVLFLRAANTEEPIGFDRERGVASHESWTDWTNRAGDAIVDPGARTQASSHGESASCVVAYSIMQARSLDNLYTLLADHPHHLAGDGFEILELFQDKGSDSTF